MIISLVWLIFYYIQRFRYMQAKDQQSVSGLFINKFKVSCVLLILVAQSVLCYQEGHHEDTNEDG